MYIARERERYITTLVHGRDVARTPRAELLRDTPTRTYARAHTMSRRSGEPTRV